MLPFVIFALTLSSAASDKALFIDKVQPILQARCYGCHSAEAGKVKGGLRVDSREALLKGGHEGPALVPGRPKESLLVRAIGYADPDVEMPPDEKLPAGEIAILTQWVKA